MGSNKGRHYHAPATEAAKKADCRNNVKRNLPADIAPTQYTIVRRARQEKIAESLLAHDSSVEDTNPIFSSQQKWFKIDGAKSHTYYFVDSRTHTLKHGVRVLLFKDMTAEDFASYQKVVNYFAIDKSIQVSPIKTNGALVSGKMYGIGYRSAMDAYLDESGTRHAAQYGTYAMKHEAYSTPGTGIRAQDLDVHTWYGKQFEALSPAVFADQQGRAMASAAPLIGASSQLDGYSNLFASSLTYTLNGFSNKPHCDRDISNHFAFGIFMPILTSAADNGWKLAPALMGYKQLHGGFINGHYRVLVDMPTIDGVVEQFWDSHSDVHATLQGQWSKSSYTQLGVMNR